MDETSSRFSKIMMTMRVIRIVKICKYATVKKKKHKKNSIPAELNKIQGFETNVEHEHKIFLSHEVSLEECIVCLPNNTPTTNLATAPLPEWLTVHLHNLKCSAVFVICFNHSKFYHHVLINSKFLFKVITPEKTLKTFLGIF